MAFFPGCSSIFALFHFFFSLFSYFCHLSRAECMVLSHFRSSARISLCNHLVAQFVGVSTPTFNGSGTTVAIQVVQNEEEMPGSCFGSG
jgi:hypothetical protein